VSHRSPTHRRPPATTDAALEELLAEDAVSLDTLVSALASEGLAPSPGSHGAKHERGRARLLDAVAEAHRFDDLEATVASLLDIDAGRAGRMLLDIDHESAWESGPNPACSICHVEGGPKVHDAVTGFVRISPGGHFPDHEHLGDETVLVLQGALRDVDGSVVGAGQIARKPAGSAHTFAVEGDLPLVYLAIVQRGLVIDGEPILAGDPRG
jgi:quercetin dioxygenase-like cupin family protein